MSQKLVQVDSGCHCFLLKISKRATNVSSLKYCSHTYDGVQWEYLVLWSVWSSETCVLSTSRPVSLVLKLPWSFLTGLHQVCEDPQDVLQMDLKYRRKNTTVLEEYSGTMKWKSYKMTCFLIIPFALLTLRVVLCCHLESGAKSPSLESSRGVQDMYLPSKPKVTIVILLL